MTSKDRANLCARVGYMGYLFHEKSIPIHLDEVIQKTEYLDRLDLVIDEVLRIYNDKFTTQELEQITEFNSKDFLREYVMDGYSVKANLEGIEEVCSQKDIIYSFDTKDKGDFVMEVDASHQAEVDSLLAIFSNTGVDICFQLASDHTFQLMIHNTNGVVPETDLISMLEESLVCARRDVDYLEGMVDEAKSSQVSFMACHPEVFNSYVYVKKDKHLFQKVLRCLLMQLMQMMNKVFLPLILLVMLFLLIRIQVIKLLIVLFIVKLEMFLYLLVRFLIVILHN